LWFSREIKVSCTPRTAFCDSPGKLQLPPGRKTGKNSFIHSGHNTAHRTGIVAAEATRSDHNRSFTVAVKLDTYRFVENPSDSKNISPLFDTHLSSEVMTDTIRVPKKTRSDLPHILTGIYPFLDLCFSKHRIPFKALFERDLFEAGWRGSESLGCCREKLSQLPPFEPYRNV
jgi:hypothetical protein